MSFDGPPAPPPLDLLDEYWFFSNTLNLNKKQSKTKLPPKSPSTAKPSLLRSPSLPPPRRPPHVHDKEDDEEERVKKEQEAEVDDDDLNWSSIYEGVLRARMAIAGQQQQGSSRSSSAALQRAPSMPFVPSSEKEMPSMPSSNGKLRHSYSTLERHCRSSNYKQQAAQKQTARSSSSNNSNKHKQQKPPVTMMVRSKSALFHDQAADKKKWKSSSDLESIEVQGFKDLGFVFDKEELRENLANVLPGLKSASTDDHGSVRRPYLSEAWHQDRRPPALIRVQSEARSAAEMKDQLRMWAQAVACNVRQECA